MTRVFQPADEVLEIQIPESHQIKIWPERLISSLPMLGLSPVLARRTSSTHLTAVGWSKDGVSPHRMSCLDKTL